MCGGDGQGELFDVDTPPRQPPKLAAPPTAPTYTRYRTSDRVLCDDCVRDIHARGINVAPYPQAARWLCRMPDGSRARVCETHRRARLPLD